MWNVKTLYTEDYCRLGSDAIFIGRTFTPPVRYLRSVLILPSRLNLGLKVVHFQTESRHDVNVLTFLLLTFLYYQVFSSVPCSPFGRETRFRFHIERQET